MKSKPVVDLTGGLNSLLSQLPSAPKSIGKLASQISQNLGLKPMSVEDKKEMKHAKDYLNYFSNKHTDK